MKCYWQPLLVLWTQVGGRSCTRRTHSVTSLTLVGLLVSLSLSNLFSAWSHSLDFLGMLWVSRDPCSLVDQAPGECIEIKDGGREALILPKLVFECVVWWLLTAGDSVLYFGTSRCKAVISWVADFFTRKSPHSSISILLKSVHLCSSASTVLFLCTSLVQGTKLKTS